MGSSRVRVEPCGGALCAEIHGVDLREPLADAVAADIYEAWLEHQVIFLRDQTITPAQQVAFAAQLGEVRRLFLDCLLPKSSMNCTDDGQRPISRIFTTV